MKSEYKWLIGGIAWWVLASFGLWFLFRLFYIPPIGSSKEATLFLGCIFIPLLMYFRFMCFVNEKKK